MATMSFAKSAAVMNISSSFPQTPSVSFLKVSTVSFPSSFNANQERNIAARQMKCRAKDSAAGQAAEKIDEGIAKATELSDSAKAKAAEGIETAKAKSGELQAGAKDAKESVNTAWEATKDRAQNIKDAVVGKE
ncbi:hypothetical protein MKX01_007728 [Papaver californicum]|nr:hypothetical protein MKX01_007728 [Papaver californicum]